MGHVTDVAELVDHHIGDDLPGAEHQGPGEPNLSFVVAVPPAGMGPAPFHMGQRELQHGRIMGNQLQEQLPQQIGKIPHQGGTIFLHSHVQLPRFLPEAPARAPVQGAGRTKKQEGLSLPQFQGVIFPVLFPDPFHGPADPLFFFVHCLLPEAFGTAIRDPQEQRPAFADFKPDGPAGRLDDPGVFHDFFNTHSVPIIA